MPHSSYAGSCCPHGFPIRISHRQSLMMLWRLLTADSITVQDATDEIRDLLASVRLSDCFDREFWKGLAFFALVEPANKVLPIRTTYNGRTTNIGINRLSSTKPIWYSGPDLVIRADLRALTPGHPHHQTLPWRDPGWPELHKLTRYGHYQSSGRFL